MKTYKITYWKNGELYFLLHRAKDRESVGLLFNTPDVKSIEEVGGMELDALECKLRSKARYGSTFYDGLD